MAPRLQVYLEFSSLRFSSIYHPGERDHERSKFPTDFSTWGAAGLLRARIGINALAQVPSTAIDQPRTTTTTTTVTPAVQTTTVKPAVSTTPPITGEINLTPRVEDERAIKAVANEFTRAFNAGDARAIANLFAADAELIDETGAMIQGRAAIQDYYSNLFAERKGATIEISMRSLRFLGLDTAKETGQTRVKPAASEPESYRDYTVLYIKQNGRWMYSSVHEEHPSSLAHNDRLKELDWLVGEWVDETSDSVIYSTCRWSDDRNFLLRDFIIHVQGKPVMTVNQRIGWDPATKQIKSWVFDSDGGYGDSLWARDGDQWIIKSNGILTDGRAATATHTLTRTGPNSARWATTHRTLGSQVIPDHRESVMVRRPPQPMTHTSSR